MKKEKRNYWKIAFWVLLALFLLVSYGSSASQDDYNDLAEDHDDLIEDYNDLIKQYNNSMHEIADDFNDTMYDFNDKLYQQCQLYMTEYLAENDCWERGTVECYDRGSVNCYER